MNKSRSNPPIELEAVLEVLREHKGRALHVMEVCARLRVPSGQRDEVRSALEVLDEEGFAQQLPGLRYKLVKRRESRRVAAPSPPAARSQESAPRAPSARLGTLRIHARGHGFVACEGGQEDVFVAPADLLGALHGDRVAVSTRRGQRGLEGVIVAILSRGQKYVVGSVERSARGLVIHPQDARSPEAVHIVGRVPGDAVPGVAVVAEILRFPDDGRAPEAEVVRVLGVEGSANVEVEKVKLREGIVEAFADEVLEAAEAFGTRISARDRKGRSDLRDWDFVTIDPRTARDHDDAIFIEPGPSGGYHVAVAIADVSHYVTEGSILDDAALERCTSIYLPDRAIPMLPHALSSSLASLMAGKDRLALVVDMQLSASGAVRRFRYVEAIIRCKAALTYEGVARALELSEDGPRERAAVRLLPMLELLHDCAMVRRARRLKRGSLDFDLPEPQVELDADTGEPSQVRRARKDPGVRRAYQLVEEMMLLTNETVAADLAERKLPTIYRVHGLPDERRLSQFAGLAEVFGFDLEPEQAADPKELSRFMRSLEPGPSKSALSYLLLRSMQQASYDVVNVGHFGLAAEHYLHFTSPIRRYPDLAVHRIVRKLARGEPIDVRGTENKLREQAATASKLERRAMQVEREVMDVYRCLLVKPFVGEEFEATVTGVAPHGIYCTFEEPFVEALCHVASLGNDFYELDQHGLRLFGRRSGASYGLGDPLTLRLESVNVSERAILASPVVYVHPDELEARGVDPVHEGGRSRPKRERRRSAREDSGAPSRKRATKKPSARKQEHRRERRSRDERKEERRKRRRR